MPDRKPSPDDLLTAQDIIAQYGVNPVVVESMMRYFGKCGVLENLPAPREEVKPFRRDFVRRKYVETERQFSGGTT